MKKLFTLTILSLMLLLTIINSCSKSSDSTTPSSPTTNPTTGAVGLDSVIIDGGTAIHLNSVSCIVGSANIFTMTFASDDDNTYLSATFSAQPTTAGNYNIKFTQPAAATDVQLKVSQNGITGTYYTAQTAGTAALTFVNSQIQLKFTAITFIHGSTNKVASSTILCQ